MPHLIGIDPTIDYAFKSLLDSPEHFRVTIHFLNSILCDGPRICRVEFLNPFLGKESDEDKLSVLDTLAFDDQGRRRNIQMQTSIAPELRQRLTYYNACLYVERMPEGKPYAALRPAIVICVLNTQMFPGKLNMHTDFRLRDQTGQVLTDDLQLHTLELTKLTVTRENLSTATPAECWAYSATRTNNDG